MALLALIAGQDVEPAEDSDGTDGRWRIAHRVAPDRVISTVDPEARHAHKSVHRRQDGFKAHVAVEPDTGIITDCALTKAGGADTPRRGSGARSFWPGETAPVSVLADRPTAVRRFSVLISGSRVIVIGSNPRPSGLRCPAVAPSMTSLLITAAVRVTCPAGSGSDHQLHRGNATFGAACRGCALRAQCTNSIDGRNLKIATPRRTPAQGP